MARKQVTIEHLDASINRWKSRLRRAVNMIDKLEKQRKRLAVRVSVPAHPTVDSETTLGAMPPSLPMTSPTATIPSPNVPTKPTEIDTDIPAFLRRQKPGTPIGEQIAAEQAATKKAKARGRIDKMKAKQRGDLKRMPLTGKAALAAIRG